MPGTHFTVHPDIMARVSTGSGVARGFLLLRSYAYLFLSIFEKCCFFTWHSTWPHMALVTVVIHIISKAIAEFCELFVRLNFRISAMAYEGLRCSSERFQRPDVRKNNFCDNT